MQDVGAHAVTETAEPACDTTSHWLNRAVAATGEGWAVVDASGRVDEVAGSLFAMLDAPRMHAQPGTRLREAVRALRSDLALAWPPRGPGWRWAGRRHDGRHVELEALSLDDGSWLLRTRWAAPEIVPAPELGTASLYHPTTRLPQPALLLDRLQQAVERSQRTVTHRFALILVGLEAIAGIAAERALLKALARSLEDAVRPADTVAHLDGETLAVIVEPVRGDDATAQVAIESVVANLQGALNLVPADLPVGAVASFAVALGDGGSHASDLIALARSRIVRRAPAGDVAPIRLAGEFALSSRDRVATVARLPVLPDADTLLRALDADPSVTGVTTLVLAPEGLPAVETLQALAVATARAPMELVIELDETAVARDPEAAIQLADAARARGITVGLAGFGKGRCADALIARLPLRRLTFDPEFTVDARHSAAIRVRLAAAIATAHERGLAVVAAAVADEAHAALLASLGCDAARGPLFDDGDPDGLA